MSLKRCRTSDAMQIAEAVCIKNIVHSDIRLPSMFVHLQIISIPPKKFYKRSSVPDESGSADPYNWITDTDPNLFFSGFLNTVLVQ
jgi:hypothetical protein